MNTIKVNNEKSHINEKEKSQSEEIVELKIFPLNETTNSKSKKDYEQMKMFNLS